MLFYGVDVGFGWTKYCRGVMRNGVVEVERGKFPTAFAHINDGVGVEEWRSYHVYEGTRYLCGEDAVHSASGFSIRDIDALIRYAPVAVAEVFRRTWDEGLGSDVELAVGLPPADFRAYRGKIQKVLREVTVTGRGVVIPRRVEVYPQAVVAKVEVDLVKPVGRALLLDVGHNTTDVVSIVGGRIAPNDCMTISMGGIARVVKEFGELARFKYGLTFATMQEACDVMLSGHCWSFGRHIEFNGDIDGIVRGYAEWLLAKVRERWEERLRLAEALIVLGGGASILVDHLPDEMKGMVRVLNEPEYANARSYTLLLCKQHGYRVVFPS